MERQRYLEKQTDKRGGVKDRWSQTGSERKRERWADRKRQRDRCREAQVERYSC